MKAGKMQRPTFRVWNKERQEPEYSSPLLPQGRTGSKPLEAQWALWRKQGSRMRLQETGERKFRFKLRDRDPSLAADPAKIRFQNV